MNELIDTVEVVETLLFTPDAPGIQPELDEDGNVIYATAPEAEEIAVD